MKYSNKLLPPIVKEEKIQLSKWIQEVSKELARLKRFISFRKWNYYDDWLDNEEGTQNLKLKSKWEAEELKYRDSINGLEAVQDILVRRRTDIILKYNY